MNGTPQQAILADLARRFDDARLDEDYKSKARLLVMMLAQCHDERGDIPEHFHQPLRERMNELLADVPRIENLLHLQKVAAAIKLVEGAIPDPRMGTAFKSELPAAEQEEIRTKYPRKELKPAVEERPELNGQACLPAETQDGEPPEDVEESPEVTGQEWLSESGCWEPPGAPVEAPNCYRSQEWFDAQPGGSHSNGNPGPARPISSTPSRLVPGSERWILEQKKTSNPAPCPPIKKKAPKKPSESSKRPIDVVMAYRPRRQYRR